MGNTIKSILSIVLIGSIIFAVWKIWGVTGQLDVLFLMIWDWVFSVFNAGSEVIVKAWEAIIGA